MKFSFVSTTGDALPLARALAQQGHDVLLYTTSKRYNDDGTCNRQDAPYLGNDAVVVFDAPGVYGAEPDRLRKQGTSVVGGGDFADSIQLTPGYADTLLMMGDSVPLPVGFDVEAWFNGEDWIVGLTSVSVVERRFLTGGVGVSVDYMGITSCFFKRYRPACFKDTLYKLGKFLKKVQYRGPVAVRNGRLECKFSAAMSNVFPLMVGSNLPKVLSETGRGTLKKISTNGDYAMGARVTLPPFPYKASERDELVAVTGATVSEAKYSLSALLKLVEPVEAQYRTDIGIAAQKIIPNLLKEDTILGRS